MNTLIFDIETNGLLDTLTTVHSLVIKDADTGEVESYADQPDYHPIREGLDRLATAGTIVGHNILKFDIPAIQKVYPGWRPEGTVRDTLILARLFWPELKRTDAAARKAGRSQLPGSMVGKYSLEAFGYRLGIWKGDYARVMKDRGLDPWAAWNPEMQAYCVQDVEVTARLWRKCLARWRPEDGSTPFSDESVDLEHAVAKIINRQEARGFAFDRAKAEKLYLDLIQRRAELEEDLKTVFEPWWVIEKEDRVKTTRRIKVKDWGPIGYRTVRGKGGPRKEPVYPVALYEEGATFTRIKRVEFNCNSRHHIADRLIKVHGWKPTEFGDDGKPTIDDTILSQLPWPEAKRIAEYLMVQKRIGQLAEGNKAWLKVEVGGRIHGSVITNGAVTGRMTHNDPNLAQVPANHAPYGERCRELFMASPGYRLVGCDADALELRCLAGYMALYDGGAYIDVVLRGDKTNGTDIHSVNARALGMEPKGKVHIDGREFSGRDIAKVWFYAFIYGAGDHKLGSILGVRGSDKKITAAGNKSRAEFLANLPALGKLVNAVRLKAKARGFVIGLDGRKIFTRSQHAALNTLLQGAGAILMKKALVILDADLQAAGLQPGRDYEFVANVHDEWQIEALPAHAELVGKTAAEAIKKAGEEFNFKCPLAGQYAIGDNWAQTH